MSDQSSPRLFGLPAAAADIVAVIRRGPSDWCHVGRWDTAGLRYDSGSWLRGKIFPQRSDLSPDGRWLCTMAMKGGRSYLAVSRLPWLHALALWNLGDAWGRGAHFLAQPTEWIECPDEGTIHPIRQDFGMSWTRIDQFAVERRRGWVESPDSPPRASGDIWDQLRAARIEKPQPAARRPLLLQAEGPYAAFREQSPDDCGGGAATYSLADGADIALLEGVQWADWNRDGGLLVATTDGRIQIRRTSGLGRSRVVFEQDLGGLQPDPQPPPPEALKWTD